ncbi:TPA: hypothetical protein I8Y21_006178 [Klebsiella oxytoca]|uniref:Uncharacterized protein n=1 Tax=Klebsiella oxytoca TaxID=571 RepID=A0AAN5RH11_KLEOX|nr:hypothetical protein [Klebsiella oxytoca]
MLRFHGKDLKAVLTEAISRDKPVMLTCDGDKGVFLSVQDAERFGADSRRAGQLRHQAFADGCHPDQDAAGPATSRLLAGYRWLATTTTLALTEGRMWDMITKHHQLTLTLSARDIGVFSGERHYVPVAEYRDFTDRMHVTAVGHFDACNSRSDLRHWCTAALRLLRDVRPLACRHASPYDHHQFLMAAHNLQRRTECVSPDGALRLLSA